jgi:hypothetical protein
VWPRVQCVAVTTGRLRRRWEDNIKVNFRGIGLEGGGLYWVGRYPVLVFFSLPGALTDGVLSCLKFRVSALEKVRTAVVTLQEVGLDINASDLCLGVVQFETRNTDMFFFCVYHLRSHSEPPPLQYGMKFKHRH